MSPKSKPNLMVSNRTYLWESYCKLQCHVSISLSRAPLYPHCQCLSLHLWTFASPWASCKLDSNHCVWQMKTIIEWYSSAWVWPTCGGGLRSCQFWFSSVWCFEFCLLNLTVWFFIHYLVFLIKGSQLGPGPWVTPNLSLSADLHGSQNQEGWQGKVQR